MVVLDGVITSPNATFGLSTRKTSCNRFRDIVWYQIVRIIWIESPYIVAVMSNIVWDAFRIINPIKNSIFIFFIVRVLLIFFFSSIQLTKYTKFNRIWIILIYQNMTCLTESPFQGFIELIFIFYFVQLTKSKWYKFSFFIELMHTVSPFHRFVELFVIFGNSQSQLVSCSNIKLFPQKLGVSR